MHSVGYGILSLLSAVGISAAVVVTADAGNQGVNKSLQYSPFSYEYTFIHRPEPEQNKDKEARLQHMMMVYRALDVPPQRYNIIW